MTASPRRTVLVIEDSPEDRTHVRRLLLEAGQGHTVVEAEDGAEGVEACRRVHPDCVLLDFHLPDMEGPEILDALRSGREGQLTVPVLVLTGAADDAAAVAALGAGAQDYVVKGTLSALGLARAVENAIEKFAIYRQLESKTRALEEHAAELEAQKETLEVRNLELDTVRAVLEAKVAELAQATAVKDQFMAVMSHEMRTPLNAILGYVELMEMGIGGDVAEGHRAPLERIRLGSRHLLELINDVLDLARAATHGLELDIRPVDLQAVMEEVVALLEGRAIIQGIELRVEPCATAVPYVSADLQRLRQVLINLVSNAIKFTDEGSVILRCTGDPDGLVRVSVADTGLGISPEVLPLVFEEFYQADGELTRARGGSGLGLAISRRLAQLMGGEIAVESVLGSGSIFTLAIPAASADGTLRDEDVQHQGARRLEQEHGGRPAPAPRTRIPVVAYSEAEEALVQLERRVRSVLCLHWTTDADEVPELARRERASLVVLDMASGGQAWSAAYALRSMPELAGTAVLLLPAIPSETDGEERGGFDLGWVSLVPKPFTAGQLARAVSTAVAGEDQPEGAPAIAACDALVVDDDPDSRRVASRFLEAEGVQVREAADGESALAEMRRRVPDVVVMDLMMPVLDGFGVLAAMRADPLLAGVPVVVLSAKSLTPAERAYLARTASRVVQKGEHRLADVAALVLRAATRVPPAPS